MMSDERPRKVITRECLINKPLPPIFIPAADLSTISPSSSPSVGEWPGKRSTERVNDQEYSPRDKMTTTSSFSPVSTTSDDDNTRRLRNAPRIGTPNLPTPQLSPSIFSYFIRAKRSSSLSPPSLDESVTSEQLGHASDPPTPVMGNNEASENSWMGGVQLQPAAMATLRALSSDDEKLAETFESLVELKEKESKELEIPQLPVRKTSSDDRKKTPNVSSEPQNSPDSFVTLDIPSPESFFSKLSPSAREAWSLDKPSIIIAERFYKVSSDLASIGFYSELTKTRFSCPASNPLPRQTINQTKERWKHSCSLENALCDAKIANCISASTKSARHTSDIIFDRTKSWVVNQSLLLSKTAKTAHHSDDPLVRMMHQEDVPKRIQDSESVLPASRHRSTEWMTSSVPRTGHRESAYYQIFRDLLARSSPTDVFVHRTARIEALQYQLLHFPTLYHAQLLAKCQLNPVDKGHKNMRPFSVTGENQIHKHELKMFERDKEQKVLMQVLPAIWNILAIKYLNGGRLFVAPLSKLLNYSPTMKSTINARPHDQVKVLDLSGQPICDWAWHCAIEYPAAQVCTVTTKALHQEMHFKISGPENHQSIMIDSLGKLPFDDNQFDLVSTRDIYTLLKSQTDDNCDEWTDCLRECRRVLKPGGFLEFCIMDSNLMNAGPLGMAKSEEFAFKLRAHGYDPYPSEPWLQRLEEAGFTNIHRSWLFLPLGEQTGNQALRKQAVLLDDTMETDSICNTENVASISGLVGAWAWEKWLLRYHVQNGGVEGALNQVYNVIDEGRKCGAGWRCVTGWAQKA